MDTLSTFLTTTGQRNSASMIFIIAYVIIFGAIIYFMMIRPQKKQKAKTDAMQQQMAPGDNIMTTSGFYGTILDVVDDTTIIVEFGNNKNCRIPMHKNAVAELEKQGAAVDNGESDKPAESEKKEKKSKL